MTVTYTSHVATVTGLGCFWKLLFRWRGSVFKLLWPNFVLYCALYTALTCLYRFALETQQKIYFEHVSKYCAESSRLIQIEFILGFYVKLVVQRWWTQYLVMPWPDSLALLVSTTVHGQDDRGRLLRRTIMRYVNMSINLVFRMMSPQVKKRFPTMEHFVVAGLLTSAEKTIIEKLDAKCKYPVYWVPLVWAGGVITRGRREGRLRDDYSVKTLIDTLNLIRSGLENMLHYDWICIPLVYTQVVTIAVYIYFGATLMGTQPLDTTRLTAKDGASHFDMFVPVFTFLQFLIYMGWLKVAEALVNPWGEDDDDFELNWLIDRNLQMSYVIVDEMHDEHPELLRDQYWDEVFPTELPYTAGTKQYQHSGAPIASTDLVEVTGKDAMFVPMETIAEESLKEEDVLLNQGNDTNDLESGIRRESTPVKIERWNTDLLHDILDDATILSSRDNITSMWQKATRESNNRPRSGSSSNSHFNSVSDASQFAMDPGRRTTPSSFFTDSTLQEEDIFSMSEELFHGATDRALPSASWGWHQCARDVPSSKRGTDTGSKEFATDLKPVDLSLPDASYNGAVSSMLSNHVSWDAPTRYRSSEARSETENASVPTDVPIIIPVGIPILHTFFSTLNEAAADLSYTLITLLSPSPEFPLDADASPSEISIPTMCSGSAIPTTSIVTTQPAPSLVTETSSSSRSPRSSHAIVVEPFSTEAAITKEERSRPELQGDLSSPIRSPSSSYVIDYEPRSTEEAIAKEERSRPELQDGISSPFIPSAAIPVPAVSPAHAGPPTHSSDQAVVVMETRRAHFELEPISEQSEALSSTKDETVEDVDDEDVNELPETGKILKKSDSTNDGGNSSKS